MGGIVPNIAAKNHALLLPKLLEKTLSEASITIQEISFFASTGPGLIGSLLAGTIFAKTMSSFLEKPFYPIHHLEAHALMARYENSIPFPYLLLLVSGGHSQYVLVHNVGRYEILGKTLDDAVGEAFDKVARMLHLDYPGGPALEKLAVQGNPFSIPLPKPLIKNQGVTYHFQG